MTPADLGRAEPVTRVDSTGSADRSGTVVIDQVPKNFRSCGGVTNPGGQAADCRIGGIPECDFVGSDDAHDEAGDERPY